MSADLRSDPALLAEFTRLCEAHDLTYDYSDDGNTYRRGREQRIAIYDFAKRLDRADAVRIWNEQVDRKLIKDAREPFYWKVP